MVLGDLSESKVSEVGRWGLFLLAEFSVFGNQGRVLISGLGFVYYVAFLYFFHLLNYFLWNFFSLNAAVSKQFYWSYIFYGLSFYLFGVLDSHIFFLENRLEWLFSLDIFVLISFSVSLDE